VPTTIPPPPFSLFPYLDFCFNPLKIQEDWDFFFSLFFIEIFVGLENDPVISGLFVYHFLLGFFS
jgi:hypothetical protein